MIAVIEDWIINIVIGVVAILSVWGFCYACCWIASGFARLAKEVWLWLMNAK